MTDKKDENAQAIDGTLPATPSDGTEPARLRVVRPDERPEARESASLSAEVALLGALMWAGKNQPESLRVAAVSDLLDTSDVFSDKRNGDTFVAIRACAAEKQEHDPVAVLAQLVKSGRAQSVGGRDRLEALVESASTVSERQARVYAQTIRDTWVRRTVYTDARALAELARNHRTSVADLIEQAKKVYGGATDRTSVSSTSVSLRESAETLFKELRSASKNWFSTGLRDLDLSLSGGLRPRETSILAARTNVGKSLLACQISEHIVTQDTMLGALYVSLEMNHRLFTARLLAARAGVPLKAIRTLELQNYWASITKAINELRDKGLYFADSPSQTMASIFATALERKKLLAREGKRLALVVVDHLGLVKPSAEMMKKANREQQVAETSRALRYIADEIGCHVMGIAQIGRDSEKTGDRMPKLHQLRESGAIEQDADLVLIMHRERREKSGQFNNDKPPALALAKARMDETAIMLLGLDTKRMHFGDWVGSEDFDNIYGGRQ